MEGKNVPLASAHSKLTESSQKSREKNVTFEETRRRNEASLARKRINAGLANGSATVSDAPVSPSSSGAMDSLLEKLRAAAPQARDQRDRRRRARLKERHQVRVASGQQIPDISLEDEANDPDAGSSSDRGLLSPDAISDNHSNASTHSEGEDIADRAASMLQGLRGDGGPDAEAERVRRRRENADDERRNRRMRRRTAANSVGNRDESALSPVIEAANSANNAAGAVGDTGLDSAVSETTTTTTNGLGVELGPGTPTIIVSPTTDTMQIGSSPPPEEDPDEIPK